MFALVGGEVGQKVQLFLMERGFGGDAVAKFEVSLVALLESGPGVKLGPFGSPVFAKRTQA